MNNFNLAPLAALLALVVSAAQAAEPGAPIKFNYEDTEVTKILKDYAAATGQAVIVAPEIKGKITILNPGPVTPAEAFNQLSTALAANRIGIIMQDGVMNVKESRAIQRDSIPVVQELPAERPERMVTWVVSLKHISADEVNKQLRILTSRDGELVVFTPKNQLIVSDWTPNLHRIRSLLSSLDVPGKTETPAGAKAAKRAASTNSNTK